MALLQHSNQMALVVLPLDLASMFVVPGLMQGLFSVFSLVLLASLLFHRFGRDANNEHHWLMLRCGVFSRDSFAVFEFP